MIKLNINEIKAHLSEYIERVQAGETIVVCKRNVPVAEIRAVKHKEKKRPELGWVKGPYHVPADFKDMTNEEIRQWEGDEKDPLLSYKPRQERPGK